MKIQLSILIVAFMVSACLPSETACKQSFWVKTKRNLKHQLLLAKMRRHDRIMKKDTGDFYKPDALTWKKINGNKNAEGFLAQQETIVGTDIQLPKLNDYTYEVRTRNSKLQVEMTVKVRMIEVLCWDHGLVDGDIITLYLDSKLVAIVTLREKSKAKPIQIRLHPNRPNHLVMFANNEGTVSPNTASISVNNTEVVLSANYKENAVLKINYKKNS